MSAPVDRDIDRLELILEVIGRLQRRLQNASRETLLADDRDELDLTAYRLSAIGEETNRLSDDLQGRHPEIDWRGIYHMRNVVAHGYRELDPVLVWNVTGKRLLELQQVCRDELLSKGISPGSPAAWP